MGKQNIVIVGGGSAGVGAARVLSRALDPSKYSLILINPLPYRVWLVATLRVVVSPNEQLEKDAMIPYDKIFANGNGKFVEGVVKSFKPDEEGPGGGSVTLESGESIAYVVQVLCSKSIN
jgi:NADH dehydrogenase FAD-containing subunit